METTARSGQKKMTQTTGLLFFGIHQIGVDALTALIDAGYDIAAVITKPGNEEENQPVATLTRRLGLPLFSPPTLESPVVIEELKELAPRLVTVAGYHQKIPQALLDLPPLGAVNLHGSLLPRYRGPTPWKWAILRGEEVIGATVHVMTPKIDRGDILGQTVVRISNDDTGESLFRKIAAVGGPLLADVVGQVMAGSAQRWPQDEAQASYFSAPNDADGQIDWKQDAVSIRNLVRGLNLRPGAWTLAVGARVRVLKANVDPIASPADPGTLLEISTRGWRVATGSNDLWLEELHSEVLVTRESILEPKSDAAIKPGIILGDSAANEPL